MFKRFLPQETGFYDFFERHSDLIVEACTMLLTLKATKGRCSTNTDLFAEASSCINDIEHKADLVARECIAAIHKTFITPIDRNDIHRLIRRMDDIVDLIDAASTALVIYQIDEIRPEMNDLIDVLFSSSEIIQEAVKGLRKKYNAAEITEKCISIHLLENKADTILRRALVRLFKEVKDPILVIQWKEIFEFFEGATDKCDDVANTIEGIVIEGS